MMEEKLLEALSHVDEKYIEEALPPCAIGDQGQEVPEETPITCSTRGKRNKMYSWMKWSMAAACLCLIVYAGIRYLPANNEDAQEEITGEWMESSDESMEEPEEITGESTVKDLLQVAEKHPILVDMEADVWGGGGGAVTLYDISELESGNPLSPENIPDTLPVYRNLSYHDASGIPVYLEEAELLGLAEAAAEALETTATELIYQRLEDYSGDYKGDKRVVMVTADTEVATIEVEADGLGMVSFEEPIEAPPEYQLIGQQTADEDVKAAVYYLTEQLSDWLELEDAVVYSNYYYWDNGRVDKDYYAYNRGTTEVESFLNYQFAGIRFAPSFDENGVNAFWYGDKRRSAEYIKDYPLMSPEEAEKLLLSGQYFNSTDPETSQMGLSGGVVRKPELTYRVLNSCKLYIPYYLFYAEVPQVNSEAESLGLKSYLPYYVPAIERVYWDEVADLINNK